MYGVSLVIFVGTLLDMWVSCQYVVEPGAEVFGCAFPLDLAVVDDFFCLVVGIS